MHILIIGNGFDIAHGLPTKYIDFLKYCVNYKSDNPISDNPDLNEEFSSFCNYNFWLKYFYHQFPDINEVNKNTWIDFEKEIAETIRKIEASEIEIDSSKMVVHMNYTFKSGILLKEIFYECKHFDDHDENTFDAFVYSQLRKFTRAFEIYCLYVNELSISKPIINTQRKDDMEKTKFRVDSYEHQARNASGYAGQKDKAARIEKLRDEEKAKYSQLSSGICPSDFLSFSIFHCILSFNYTNTYERLYGNDKTRYCYIHGKAQNDRKKTNIILGIDDDLPPDKQSKDFRWIRFKKFYQRIIFKTGSEYKDWFNSKQENTVHIVGHSLDKTDYDILYEIFNDSHSRIIVYYHSPEDFNDKVQKVIRLLSYKGKNGRDELIRRVHGSKWSVKFVDQYDEKDGLFIRPSD